MCLAPSRVFRVPELAVVVGAVCSCAGPGASFPDGDLPRDVSADVLGAVIAPVKADRTPWDGAATLPGDMGSALAAAFEAAQPYEAVLNVLAGIVTSAFDKPDPFGSAEPRGTSLATLRLSSTSEDTLTPVWQPIARWPRLPLRSDVQLLVSLQDRDVLGSDPIETVSIGYPELVAALRSGGVYPVDVHKQGRGQLLFVTVLVTACATE